MEKPNKAVERLLLIARMLPNCSHRLVKHSIIGDTEYLRIEVRCPQNIRVHVREYWKARELIRYGYQLMMNDVIILRYDNTPHHPEVETRPHHKHVKGKVEPLHNPSLKAFLEEVRYFIRQHHY